MIEHNTHQQTIFFTNKYRKYFRATKIRNTIHVKSSKKVPPNIDIYMEEKM